MTGIVHIFAPEWRNFTLGKYWVILAGSLVEVGHISAIFGLACYLYGVREGYRRPDQWTAKLARWISLESMVIAGLVAMLSGVGVLVAVFVYWSAHGFVAIDNVLPPVIGTSLLAIGVQNIFGGFLLAVLGGNEAKFLDSLTKTIAAEGSMCRKNPASDSQKASTSPSNESPAAL